jgi:DNA (cytosine-5)-methyltransferase 1
MAFCENHGVVQAMQVMKKKEAWGRYRAQYVYRCPKCAQIIEPGWLPASSAIDWSIEGQRIGDREKPLSPKTMLRIEKGIERYWRPIVVEAGGNQYDSADPKHRQHGREDGYLRAWPAEEALKTLHTSLTKGVALPPLITDGIRGEGTVQSGAEALHTQTTAQTKGIAYREGLIVRGEGNESAGKHTSEPVGAITAAGSQFLVVPVEGRDGKVAAPGSDPLRTQSTRNETAIVVPLRNHGVAKPTSSPIDTVSANGNHHALLMRNNTGGAEMSTPTDEVMRTLTTGGHQSLTEPPDRAMLVGYYGNGTAAPVSDPHRAFSTVDRYSLVTAPVDVEDCYFRMLTPNEIKVGMAFGYDYILLGTKREQVKQAGNAVTPPASRDLGAAVIESLGVNVEWGWAA